MKNKSRIQYLLQLVCCHLLPLLAALLLAQIWPAQRSSIYLAGVFASLLLGILFLALLLRTTLQENFYSYSNVAFIGGILFEGVLALYLLAYFFSCIGHAERVELHYVLRSILQFPKTFSYGAVFVLSAICLLLLISNISLIRHEGFCLQNLLSLVLAALYIGGTLLLYLCSDFVYTRLTDAVETGTSPVFLIAYTVINLWLLFMLCYFECIFAGSCVMGWLAARRVPAYDKDFIIILGCSIDKRGGLLPLLKQRTNRAVRFAWEQEMATGKPLRYVPSGGQGSNEVMSEGSAMELYLLSHGAESWEVFPEKKSTSTWENMLFSKKIIDGLQSGAKVAYATTNYHIFRSGIFANRAGLDAEGIASKTKWYFWPNGFVREFFSILAINKRSHLFAGAVFGCVCLILGIVTGTAI